MSDNRIEGYARGLFEIARAEGTLDEVEDELFRFARSFESSDALRTALSDEQIPPAKRQAIIEDLLGGKATSTTTQLISMVVGSGRTRDLPAIVDLLVARASSAKHQEVAEVRTAVALTADQQARLAAAPGQRHRQTGQPESRGRSVRTGRHRGHRGRHRHRRQRPYPHRPAEVPPVAVNNERHTPKSEQRRTWLN